MKKITMLMAAAAAVVMSSCGGSSSAPKADLANGLDSLCYAYGVAQSRGFEDYAYSERGLNIDSAYADDLIKGIIDGANIGGSDKQSAYYAGIAIGQQLNNSVNKGLKYEIFGQNADSTQVMSVKDFVAGFVAALKKQNTAISADSVENYIRVKGEELKAAIMEKQYGEYKKENKAYMEKIAKAEGVKALGEGVYYKVLTEGTGAIPTTSDRVKVQYEGKTIDDNVFDSSYKRGEPVEFGVTQVIKGWTEALTHMPVGSKWEIYIPAEAAYGSADQGPIKPFSTLVFTVELLDIVK